MKYLKIRWQLSLLRKSINITIVICFLLILLLTKTAVVKGRIELIDKHIFKPFFEQFNDTGSNFTNIFNL